MSHCPTLHPLPTTTRGPRAIVLVGPPKTGSTHVQSFLEANADELRNFGWQWPRAIDGGRAGAKSFANLVGALSNRTCRSQDAWTSAPTLVDAILGRCHGRPEEVAEYKRGPAARVRSLFEPSSSASQPAQRPI